MTTTTRPHYSEGCNKPMIDYNTGEEVKRHSPPT